MHPWIKASGAAQCTLCGMNLVLSGESDRTTSQNTKQALVLGKDSIRAVGLQTATVKKQPLVRTLRVAGIIGEDETRHSVLCAPVEGRIDGLGLNCDGDQVHILQPVASIFSRTLLDAAADYNRALKTGGAELEAATQRLQRCGLTWEQIHSIPGRQPDDSHFGILSRVAGDVVKSYVSEGQYVKEGDKLFEIADLSRMWFMFTIYEQDLQAVRKGQPITISVPSLPGESFRGTISSITPNLDAATGSAQARVVLENKARHLRNNVFAEGLVETDAGAALAINRSAVLWPGKTPRVYVEITSGTYEPRAVRLGRTGDDSWEVLEGLEEGEMVVVSGNLLLDSEAQIK